MTTSKYLFVFTILILILNSCKKKNTALESGGVKYSGALRTIMSGNIQSTINIDTLAEKKHLYALGAMENLKGEIQIFDNVPSNSYVTDSTLQIKNSYNLKASLLVYAEVDEWNSFEVKNCKTKDELEVQIFKYAMNNRINIEEPFPFLLEGTPASLDWHIINWEDEDTIHTHEKHQESGLNGTMKNTKVQILGFYSTKHKAIFTHHTTNMHMHFKADDNVIAGHIDDLVLNQTIILKLPKR